MSCDNSRSSSSSGRRSSLWRRPDEAQSQPSSSKTSPEENKPAILAKPIPMALPHNIDGQVQTRTLVINPKDDTLGDTFWEKAVTVAHSIGSQLSLSVQAEIPGHGTGFHAVLGLAGPRTKRVADFSLTLATAAGIPVRLTFSRSEPSASESLPTRSTPPPFANQPSDLPGQESGSRPGRRQEEALGGEEDRPGDEEDGGEPEPSEDETDSIGYQEDTAAGGRSSPPPGRNPGTAQPRRYFSIVDWVHTQEGPKFLETVLLEAPAEISPPPAPIPLNLQVTYHLLPGSQFLSGFVSVTTKTGLLLIGKSTQAAERGTVTISKGHKNQLTVGTTGAHTPGFPVSLSHTQTRSTAIARPEPPAFDTKPVKTKGG
ncbi:hypothetical protein B0H11DRAFT_2295821, partial [Mycena galericulata]